MSLYDGINYKNIPFSKSLSILEMILIELRLSGYLYERESCFSESSKNLLKDYLKDRCKWTKEQTIEAIRFWREKEYIVLENDILVFKIFPIVKRKMQRISSIENISK